MKVSVHAGQRFLERVMKKTQYDYFDVNRAMKFLEKLLQDVVPNSNVMQFVLPCFENYKVVYKSGTVVTIIPKGEKYVR